MRFFISVAVHASFTSRLIAAMYVITKINFMQEAAATTKQGIRARVLQYRKGLMHHKSPSSCAFQTRTRQPTEQFRHVHGDGHSDAMLNTIKSYQGSCQ